MDEIIKGMFNQIIGGGPQPEEEEKKAPCVFDDPPVSQANLTPLQKYATKQITPPTFPEANVKDFAAKISKPALAEDGLVKIEAIIGVMQYSLELSRKSYVDLVLTNRRERRKVFSTDKKTYSKLVVELLRKTESVMDEGTKTLLAELNIDKEVFETSIMVLMEAGYEPQLMMTQANLVQRTKEILGSTKEVDFLKVKEILRHQLSLFTDKQDEFKSLISELKGDPENAHMIPLGINLIVSDLNYDKFELEEEDIMTALKDPMKLMSDPELGGIIMACEDAVHDLLSGMGVLPPMPPGFA